MAKLIDIQMHACVGDDSPGLQFQGERAYFPHVHIGEPNTCRSPRYYKSSSYGGGLETTRGSRLTINEVGAHNHNGQVPFDALAQLIAAAPRMLHLLDRLTRPARLLSTDPDHVAARTLADRLLTLDIPDADETGWGPYYNEDGTLWENK